MNKLVSWVILFSLVVLTGCEAPGPTLEDVEKPESISLNVYTVGVGDRLAIRVWKNPELSVDVPVRPDGKISVPLIGDVEAVGLTVEDLKDNIEFALQSYIRTPQVTIVPTEINRVDNVRITGAVNAPQLVPHLEDITVLDVVLRAGGLTPFASPNQAKLYRKNSAGEMKVYPILLRDILEKGRLETNYTLEPSDIITVPERAF